MTPRVSPLSLAIASPHGQSSVASVTTRPVGISMVFSGITRLMLSLAVRRTTA